VGARRHNAITPQPPAASQPGHADRGALSGAGKFVYAYAAARLEGNVMAFYAFYVIAITILVLHFTGWLKRNNLEWLVLVLAVATFPAVIFLK
jgi:hypothetical protein